MAWRRAASSWAAGWSARVGGSSRYRTRVDGESQRRQLQQRDIFEEDTAEGMRRVYDAWKSNSARDEGFRADWHAVQFALACLPALAVFAIARWGDEDSRRIRATRQAAVDAEEARRASAETARWDAVDALARRVEELERRLVESTTATVSSSHSSQPLEGSWRWWRRRTVLTTREDDEDVSS